MKIRSINTINPSKYKARKGHRENFITGKQQWLKHNDIWQQKSPKQSDGKV